MGLTAVLFSLFGHDVTGQKLILLQDGLLLAGKSTHEICEKLEGEEAHAAGGGGSAKFVTTLVQILLLDIVFSLDRRGLQQALPQEAEARGSPRRDGQVPETGPDRTPGPDGSRRENLNWDVLDPGQRGRRILRDEDLLLDEGERAVLPLSQDLDRI